MTTLTVLTLAAVAAITTSILREPIGRAFAVHNYSGASLAARTDHSPSMLGWIGRRLRTACRQPADAVLDRAAGKALIVVVAAGFVHIGVAAMAAFGLWVRSMARRRRNTQMTDEQIRGGLADVIDLFAVGLLSGNTVAEATKQVCDWSEGEFADAFAWCNRRVDSGLTLGDALEMLPARLGPQTRPLIAALVATERYGAPIAQNLAQLAAETRADLRRQAEASARRLPVALLFPLVACVLPAFLLVTVVPVIFETFSNLDVAASP